MRDRTGKELEPAPIEALTTTERRHYATQRGRIITAVLGTVAVLFLAERPRQPDRHNPAGRPIVGGPQHLRRRIQHAVHAGTNQGQFPANEPPPNAIDNNVGAKYLNSAWTCEGINTGFYVPRAWSVDCRGAALRRGQRQSQPRPAAVHAGRHQQRPRHGHRLGADRHRRYGPGDRPRPQPVAVAGSEPTFANSTAYTSYRLLFTESGAPARTACRSAKSRS